MFSSLISTSIEDKNGEFGSEKIEYFRITRHVRMRVIIPTLLFALLSVSTYAAESLTLCTTIDDSASRLACYDREMGRVPHKSQEVPPAASTINTTVAPSALEAEPSPLSLAWELDNTQKRGLFHLVPYKLNYLLPIRYSNRTNTMPSSPLQDHNTSSPLSINETETKFQFSFKTKAWENLLGDNGDLWFAYTQRSNWQLYNNGASSPFRETNYEPEAVLSFRTQRNLFGWDWRLLNLGFVHQSNGRQLPLSRSWNRIYAQFGLEHDNFTLLIRPWYRLPEIIGKDDNPDIGDYLGSGDIRLISTRMGHVYSALGRYSLSGKRGAIELEWAFPLSRGLKGYMQITHGYGENLIDYNHSQTTMGLGILLLPW